MIAVRHGGMVRYVIFRGITETYPKWFKKTVLEDLILDESRFTLWVPENERSPDYFEKQLVEDDSVFIEDFKDKYNVHCISREVFNQMYTVLDYSAFNNGGSAGFYEDVIEYVECLPGVLSEGYPDWFYEYFTERVVFPDEETVFVDAGMGDVSITEHCVFLRNRRNEILKLDYEKFLRIYYPGPEYSHRILWYKLNGEHITMEGDF